MTWVSGVQGARLNIRMVKLLVNYSFLLVCCAGVESTCHDPIFRGWCCLRTLALRERRAEALRNGSSGEVAGKSLPNEKGKLQASLLATGPEPQKRTGTAPIFAEVLPKCLPLCCRCAVSVIVIVWARTFLVSERLACSTSLVATSASEESDFGSPDSASYCATDVLSESYLQSD